jgi:hypothetical protein
MESAARGLDANPTRAFSLGGAESTGSFPAGVQFRVALRRRSFLVWSAMPFMWCRIRRRVRAVSAVPKRREEKRASRGVRATCRERLAGWLALTAATVKFPPYKFSMFIYKSNTNDHHATHWMDLPISPDDPTALAFFCGD